MSFSTSVQVLRSIFDQNGRSTLYVTDYTARDDLVPPPSELWTKNYDRMIVKIDLRDGQSNRAKFLAAGVFCQIKNLRLRRSHANEGSAVGLAGLLAGHDQLIAKLNAQFAKDEDFLELLRYVHVTPLLVFA